MSDNPIARAQQKIAGILAELEKETGDYVSGLEILDLDITQMTHKAPHVLRRVVVRMRPKPGTRWED